MYSIRNGGTKGLIAGAAMTIAAAVGAGTGCQRIVPQPVRSPVNDTPLVVDEAMQIRDFDRSTSYYANGATVAGGTGYVWQTHEAVKPTHRRWVDAPVAVLNIVSMPVGLFISPPWKAEQVRGETVPPTYTGQPPLPGKPSDLPRTGVEVIDTPSPMQETVPPPADGALPPSPPPAPPIETTPAANEPVTPVAPPTPPAEPAPPTIDVAPVAPPTTPPATEVVPPTPPTPPVAPDATAPVTPPAPAVEPVAPESTPPTPAPVTPPPAAVEPAPVPAPATTTPLNK